jgi:hypothetical protein
MVRGQSNLKPNEKANYTKRWDSIGTNLHQLEVKKKRRNDL